MGICFLVVLISCAPRVYYLGDYLPPSNNVDVYYDTKDVEREYRTIGQMTVSDGRLERARSEMLRRAQEVGGDAIIFFQMGVETGDDVQLPEISGKVIKYTD